MYYKDLSQDVAISVLGTMEAHAVAAHPTITELNLYTRYAEEIKKTGDRQTCRCKYTQRSSFRSWENSR